MEPTFLSSEPVTVVKEPAPATPNPLPPPPPAPPAPAPYAPRTATTPYPAYVEAAPVGSFGSAAIGGLVGALIGAAVFAAIGIATDFEIGYVAVLIGFLAGRGVSIGARGAYAPSFKMLAAILSVVALVAAKYMVFAWAVHSKFDVSPFDGKVLSFFGDNFGEMLSPFDALWVILAVGAAFRAVAPAPDSR